MKLWIFFLLCVAQALHASEADPDIVKVPVTFVDRYQPPGGFRVGGAGVFRPVAKRADFEKKMVAVEGTSLLEKEGEVLEEALHSSLKKDEDFEEEWHSSLHDIDIGKVKVALQRRDPDALFYVSSDEGEVDDAEDFSTVRIVARKGTTLAAVGRVASPPKNELLEKLKCSGIAKKGRRRRVSKVFKSKKPLKVAPQKERLMSDEEAEFRMGFACRRLGAALWNADEHLHGCEAVVPAWDEFEAYWQDRQRRKGKFIDAIKK